MIKMSEIKNVFPKNIDDVVDRLISELSFKDKTKIANMVWTAVFIKQNIPVRPANSSVIKIINH